MRTILLPLAGLAALSATACTTVAPPPVAAATPVSAKQAEYCREYTSTATVGDSEQETVGVACLGPDGTWRIADPDTPPTPALASPPQTYAAAPPPVAAYPAPAYTYYPGYAYYPPPYYYAPYPYYYGPTVGVGVGFRFGGGHRHW